MINNYAEQLVDECDEKDYLFEEDFKEWLYNSSQADKYKTIYHSANEIVSSGMNGRFPGLPEGLCFNIPYIRDKEDNVFDELNIPVIRE